MSDKFIRVADGIYKFRRHFYHRPIKPDGKRTWRALDGETLKAARTSYARLNGVGLKSNLTIGEAINIYRAAECPDRHRQPRVGKYLTQELARCEMLASYWRQFKCEGLSNAVLDDYADWRMRRAKANGWDHGGRAVDIDIVTLRRVTHWATRRGLITEDPFVRMKVSSYRKPNVRHCREMAPASGNELHDLAGHLLESKRSQTLGWLTLITAMVGGRVSEMTAFRLDAQQGEPGCITEDILWMRRKKKGANNFFRIHAPLKETLEEFFKWRKKHKRYRKSPWWFPGFRHSANPVEEGALSQALRRAASELEVGRRSAHGLRSFYVTVRRSQGASDPQIALELGQTSGGREIVRTYGDALPIKLSWMPEQGDPAWSVLYTNYTRRKRIRTGSKKVIMPSFAVKPESHR